MGQKVNPHGFRVGVIQNWDSRWFVKDEEFGDTLVSDFKVRKFLKEKYDAEIEKLTIELNAVKTMRNQLITENESLKQDLKTMTCYMDTYKNKFETLNDKVIKAKNMLE